MSIYSTNNAEHYLTMDANHKRVNIYATDQGAWIVKCFENGYHIPELDSSLSLKENALLMGELFVTDTREITA